MRSSTSLTCLSALYYDHPSSVLDLCEIRYQEHGLFEGAVDLKDGNYLVSGSQKSWSMTCLNGLMSHAINSCTFCLLKLPCGCGITTSTFQIPYKITGCNNITKPTYLHPLNLPVLQSFYPLDTRINVRGTVTFSELPQISIPNITLQSSNFTSVMLAEKKFSLDFKKIAKQTNADKTLYIKPIDEYMSTDNSGMGSNFSSILVYISLATTIFSILLSFYVLCKMRSFIGLIPVSTQLPMAKAYQDIVKSTLKPFKTEDTSTDSDTSNGIKVIEINELLYVICLIVFAVSILYLLMNLKSIVTNIYISLQGFVKHSCSTSVFYLRVFNENRCTDIKLLIMNRCPPNIKLSKHPQQIHLTLNLNFLSRPSIFINWENGIMLFDTISNYPTDFPQTIYISFQTIFCFKENFRCSLSRTNFDKA